MYGPPGAARPCWLKLLPTTRPPSELSAQNSSKNTSAKGPRMVRDVLTSQELPAIIFDEIDAIATKRFDAQTGADREVQNLTARVAQSDGRLRSDNKCQGDHGDQQTRHIRPGLRPGRLDRKIEFPLPMEDRSDSSFSLQSQPR